MFFSAMVLTDEIFLSQLLQPQTTDEACMHVLSSSCTPSRRRCSHCLQCLFTTTLNPQAPKSWSTDYKDYYLTLRACGMRVASFSLLGFDVVVLPSGGLYCKLSSAISYGRGLEHCQRLWLRLALLNVLGSDLS